MKLNRRDFLKIVGSYSLGALMPRLLFQRGDERGGLNQQNVLIIVFDALSAFHISLYGYPRDTMPNLSKLAQKAVVYHHHYAGSNFTTPGTASLLTGTLPWTHRATEHDDVVADQYIQRNIFSQFDHYYRMAYSHNILANTLLKQLKANIDEYTPWDNLFLESDSIINRLFWNDQDIANVGWTRAIKQKDDGYSYSLFFSNIYESLKKKKVKGFTKVFPRGLPYVNIDNYYVLEGAMDHLKTQLTRAPRPFLGYYHFLPPHHPYHTHIDFLDAFSNDGYRPVFKPEHIFSKGKSDDNLMTWRTWYDEFILYVDEEFARLHRFLDQSGLLENTWLILTSDHGELFERGVLGHLTPMMFEPVLRIPLLIFEPGRNARMDYYGPTSGIDLLPTLLQVTGNPIPDWIEGQVLPPYSTASSDRDIFAIRAVGSNKQQPIEKASIAMIRRNHKLIYYFRYPELDLSGDLIELFDLKEDPNELVDLSGRCQAVAEEMLAIVKAKLFEANRPYH